MNIGWHFLTYGVIYLVGLAVTIWAYRARRTLGYLLIAAHFLIAGGNCVYNAVIAPQIDAANFKKWLAQQPPPTEADKATQGEGPAHLRENSRASYTYSTAPRLPIGISYLGLIAMVTGLCLIARQEHSKEVEPSSGGNR